MTLPEDTPPVAPPLDVSEPAPTAVRAASRAGGAGPALQANPSALAWMASVLALLALFASGFLWQKLNGMQEQLARQSADAGATALAANAQAKQAQDLALETAAKLAVTAFE